MELRRLTGTGSAGDQLQSAGQSPRQAPHHPMNRAARPCCRLAGFIQTGCIGASWVDDQTLPFFMRPKKKWAPRLSYVAVRKAMRHMHQSCRQQKAQMTRRRNGEHTLLALTLSSQRGSNFPDDHLPAALNRDTLRLPARCAAVKMEACQSPATDEPFLSGDQPRVLFGIAAA